MSMRLPIPMSKLIFWETSEEARSELNRSKSPLPSVTSLKYLLKRAVRSELPVYSHSVCSEKSLSA